MCMHRVTSTLTELCHQGVRCVLKAVSVNRGLPSTPPSDTVEGPMNKTPAHCIALMGPFSMRIE